MDIEMLKGKAMGKRKHFQISNRYYNTTFTLYQTETNNLK